MYRGRGDEDGDEDERFCGAEGRLKKRKGRRGESATGGLFGKGGGWFGRTTQTTPLCHSLPSPILCSHDSSEMMEMM